MSRSEDPLRFILLNESGFIALKQELDSMIESAKADFADAAERSVFVPDARIEAATRYGRLRAYEELRTRINKLVQ